MCFKACKMKNLIAKCVASCMLKSFICTGNGLTKRSVPKSQSCITDFWGLQKSTTESSSNKIISSTFSIQTLASNPIWLKLSQSLILMKVHCWLVMETCCKSMKMIGNKGLKGLTSSWIATTCRRCLKRLQPPCSDQTSQWLPSRSLTSSSVKKSSKERSHSHLQ